MRVLISVEQGHNAYGEAIAAAVGALRPHLNVSAAAPESFEESLARLRPEVVVCDRPDPARSEETLAWVELSVDPDLPTRVRVGRRRWEISTASLGRLLSVVDQASMLKPRVAAVG
jgi:hypothetical protein